MSRDFAMSMRISFQVITVILLFYCVPLSAKSYKDYFKKGDRNWKTIEYIYERYPLMVQKKEQARKLSAEWNELKKNVLKSRGKMRSQYVRELKKAYLKSNDTLRDICIELASYVNFLKKEFFKQMTPEISPGTNNLPGRWKLLEQEMKRAKTVYFQKNYHYSARLYERAASIITTIYESFDFKLPQR